MTSNPVNTVGKSDPDECQGNIESLDNGDDGFTKLDKPNAGDQTDEAHNNGAVDHKSALKNAENNEVLDQMSAPNEGAIKDIVAGSTDNHRNRVGPSQETSQQNDDSLRKDGNKEENSVRNENQDGAEIFEVKDTEESIQFHDNNAQTIKPVTDVKGNVLDAKAVEGENPGAKRVEIKTSDAKETAEVIVPQSTPFKLSDFAEIENTDQVRFLAPIPL